MKHEKQQINEDKYFYNLGFEAGKKQFNINSSLQGIALGFAICAIIALLIT